MCAERIIIYLLLYIMLSAILSVDVPRSLCWESVARNIKTI